MTRRFLLTVFAVLAIAGLSASAASAGQLTAALANELALRAPGDKVPVLIVMKQAPDYAAMDRQAASMTRPQRRALVQSRIRAYAESEQDGILPALAQLQGQGEVTWMCNLPIAGAVAATVTPEAARLLAARLDVEAVDFDAPQYMLDTEAPQLVNMANTSIPPVKIEGRPPQQNPLTIAWGVSWIGAPDVWNMGYTGTGVVIGHLDTGIWYPHTDLVNQIAYNYADPWDGIDNDGNGYIDDYYGYNFNAHSRDPIDQHGHGTHTAGTCVGDGTAGTQTGVAPGAKIKALRVLDSGGYGQPSMVVEAIQYGVANGVDVFTASIGWYQPDVATRQAFRNACEAVRIAGICMSIAAGNERGYSNPPNLIRTPGDVPPPWINPDNTAHGAVCGVTTIGATGYHNDDYAYFSSEGPVGWNTISPWYDWGSPYLLKPDVCAPGEDVNSTLMGGGYSGDTWSGTSMATPHVAGLMCLILQRNPNLISSQVDSILEISALDRGPAGKDNDYGAGRVQAVNAINATPGTDVTPPAQITNLSTAAAGGVGRVRLNWTAVGDDGMNGTASVYDVRYRKAEFGPIDTDAKFASSVQATGEPIPGAPGTPQTMVVAGLQPGHNYYFAIKAGDEIPNWGPLSNSPIGLSSGTATPWGVPGGIGINIQSGVVSADGQIIIRDVGGQVVPGAMITVQWSGLVSGVVSAKTDAQGVARFSSPTADASAQGVFQFAVTAISGTTQPVSLQGLSAQTAYGGAPQPAVLSLAQNVPNPIGVQGTSISFSLAADGHVAVRVYDVTGQMVRELVQGSLTAGPHTVNWDGLDGHGRTVANGVYYYRLETSDQTLTHKMTVLR